MLPLPSLKLSSYQCYICRLEHEANAQLIHRGCKLSFLSLVEFVIFLAITVFLELLYFFTFL